MNRRIGFNSEECEKIVFDKMVLCKKTEEIAKELDAPQSSVGNFITVFMAVQTKSVARVVDLVWKNYSVPAIRWSYNKLGYEMPKEVLDAITSKNDAKRKSNLEIIKKEEAAEKPAELKPENNDALYFIKILEGLNKQNKLLEQLLDTVIPHWAGDLKENNNVNTDLLNKQLQLIDQKVECIKLNTRKRGL